MLHPSEFFKWCAIRTGIDIFEIFDNQLKEKLMNIHPQNFIKTRIVHPVYKVTVSYTTDRGNYKELEKYMILDSPEEEEYEDFWADMLSRDYEEKYKQKINDLKILSIEHISDAVLEIG